MKKILPSYILTLFILCFLPSTYAQDDSEGIELNLFNADLNSLIQTVSRFTQRNFIVDPRVKGRVTVISAEKMDAASVYDIFIEVLAVHGYSVIPGRNSERIIPSGRVRSEAQPIVDGLGPISGDAQRASYITRIVKIENALASQMVSLLRPLIAKEGHLASHNGSNSLIISDNKRNMERILKIISQLDVAKEASLEAIPLKHAPAEEVSKTLQKLLSPAKSSKSKTVAPIVIADKRSNSILVNGSVLQREAVHRMIAEIDLDVPDESNIKVIHLRYADVEEIAPIIASLLAGLRTKSEAKNNKVIPSSLQPEPNTNSLIVTGDSEHINAVEKIIDKIDIQRDQVVVEAIIAELGIDIASEMGIQWFALDADSGNPLGITNFGTSDLLSLVGGVESAGNLGDGLSLAAGNFSSGSVTTGALIKALQRDGSTNILSTPNILTLDNQEATITVGQDVPFRTGQYNTSGDGNPFETIERSRVGLTLKVTPQISSSGSITLDIVQEVSSVVPDANLSFAASDVVTRIREIETSVSVQDGHLIAIGGLIDDQYTQDIYKVPFLGDIPAIGALFRSSRDSTTKRSLVVFLRPRILKSIEEADLFSERKYSYFREESKQFRNGVSNTRNKRENAPLLPPLKTLLELPPPSSKSGGK